MQHRTPSSIDPEVTVLLMNMFTVQHSSTRGPDREMLTITISISRSGPRVQDMLKFTSMFAIDEVQLDELRSDYKGSEGTLHACDSCAT